MFNKVTPESVGISSKNITKYIKSLERAGVVSHSILMLKGDDIFAEYYWKPFSKDKVHRMYSQTKSFVAIAIGLLYDDGKINLDDKVYNFFPEKIDKELPDNIKNMTVRDMLTMQTCGETPDWFNNSDSDRTHLYFNENNARIKSGMRWNYDSPGSQVLCALVEKLSGKSLFDFLNERIFKYLGTFKDACILKTKTEDSFGDSALLCTSRDMASFARLLMNGGKWNGKQLISEEYIKEATSSKVCNIETGFVDVFAKGYGYQIWCLDHNGFGFNGMGCQFTLCYPEKDIIFVCTGDNQGFGDAKALLVNNFYSFIYENIKDTPLPEDKDAFEEAKKLESELKLFSLSGNNCSNYQSVISGKKYICEDNSTGISEFYFEFDGDNGKFCYKNKQGNKVLPFGLSKNVFCKFPQFGYSNYHAGASSKDKNFMYDCAVSAVWAEEQKLIMKVQIIDIYLGNMFAVFSFRDSIATVTMIKNAEAFLCEYNGEFTAKAKD